MLTCLSNLPHEELVLILKSIRQLAMENGTLDLLEQAGAIPALVPYFNNPHPEVQNQVLSSMYYLCRLTPSRQEQAAVSGIIPHLQKMIRANHPLKQFAFDILFNLGKTSRRSRMELKKYGGVEFYIEALKDPYWRSPFLEVLARWLQMMDDRQRVEFILNANVNKLFTLFKTTKDVVQFDKILPHFYRIVQASIRVNRSFGRSSVFIVELKTRFDRHASNNIIRINLLKILTSIYESHHDPVKLVKSHDLLPLLTRLSEDNTSVIVVQLAQKLLKKYNSQLLSSSPSS